MICIVQSNHEALCKCVPGPGDVHGSVGERQSKDLPRQNCRQLLWFVLSLLKLNWSSHLFCQILVSQSFYKTICVMIPIIFPKVFRDTSF